MDLQCSGGNGSLEGSAGAWAAQRGDADPYLAVCRDLPEELRAKLHEVIPSKAWFSHM